MERMETSRMKDAKTNQPVREAEAKTMKTAQEDAARQDVPCCCPGCFSFEF